MRSRGGSIGHAARRAGPAVALVVAMALSTSPAEAHKLSVFATVEGNTIRGEANFRDGAPVRHAAVKVLGPAGEVLGQLQTDQDGQFRFQPKKRVDHRLLVDAGSGHAAQFTVTAAELPAQLAASPSSPPSQSPPSQSPPSQSPPSQSPPANEPDGGPPRATEPSGASSGEPEGLSDQLAQLRAEIARLRKETADAHDRLLLRDVLGGLGFLAGIGGTAFYFLGLRRQQRGVADRRSPQTTG